jgi:hypothetical protein
LSACLTLTQSVDLFFLSHDFRRLHHRSRSLASQHHCLQ